MAVIKKQSEKASSKKPQEIPVKQEPVPEQTSSVEEPVADETPVLSVDKKIKELLATIEASVQQLKQLKQEVKIVSQLYNKEVKDNKYKKKKVKDVNKVYVPHGFTKPVHISPELAEFLNVEKDTLIARPAVTKIISTYVKENKLSNEEDGSIFKTDKKLKKLLGEPRFLIKPKKPEVGYGYGYQSLQTYLAPHFMKN